MQVGRPSARGRRRGQPGDSLCSAGWGALVRPAGRRHRRRARRPEDTGSPAALSRGRRRSTDSFPQMPATATEASVSEILFAGAPGPSRRRRRRRGSPSHVRYVGLVDPDGIVERRVSGVLARLVAEELVVALRAPVCRAGRIGSQPSPPAPGDGGPVDPSDGADRSAAQHLEGGGSGGCGPQDGGTAPASAGGPLPACPTSSLGQVHRNGEPRRSFQTSPPG
jgi:hypothetical protein